MKVALVLPHIGNEGGGVTEAVRLLATTLHHNTDLNIEVVSKLPDTSFARNEWPDVPIFLYKCFGGNRFSFTPRILFHFMKHRYDIVHIHGLWTFHVLGGVIALMKGSSVYVTPHGMLEKWILNRSKFIKKTVNFLYQSFVLRKCNGIFALNSSEADSVRDCYKSQTVHIIPNVAISEKRSANFPKWYNTVFNGKKLFLFFGRIHDKKNWDLLLEAWAQQCDKDIDFINNNKLVFAGWIDGATSFKKRCSELHALYGNVHYVGPQFSEDRAATYSIADFFILPSQSEGLPMAVIEAISFDTVVMINRNCNMPELIEMGAVFDTGNTVEEIGLSIKSATLATNHSLNKMKILSSSFVKSNYSAEAIAAATDKAYKSGMRSKITSK